MENKVPDQLKPLSASRVKTLENCSWLYWCNYHLKLPQEKNEGAKKGDICHTVFEVLLNKSRRHHYDKIVSVGSITAVPSIERLIKKHIKKLKLQDTTEGFLHIDQMILVGLKSDFYVSGGTLVSPEYKFDLFNPKFRIKGFMDKPFIKGDEIIIDDFKSSKQKYAGEEQESNIQALFYSFAAKCIWPKLTPTVRFIFLQYPKNPIMVIQFTEDALLGFRYYLEDTQHKVEGFNEHAARSHFAADSPAGKDTFTGKALCGHAKSKGQLKKDGTKMWHCPYRFAYDYYEIKEYGQVKYCVFEKDEIKPLKMGQTIEKKHYDGCPRHVNAIDGLGTAITTPSPKLPYHNVIDDF